MSHLSGQLIKSVSVQFGGRVRRPDFETTMIQEPQNRREERSIEDIEQEIEEIFRLEDRPLMIQRLTAILNEPALSDEQRNDLLNIIDELRDEIRQERMNDINRIIGEQLGQGILMRDPGKLQPAGRQLLEQFGNEEIKTIDIVRTPLSSFTRGFLNVISLGQFDKITKKYYDEMFHLSLWINGKYNLEKNEVVNFNRTNPRKSNSQVKSISASNIPAGITLQSLIDNTIARMGPENFSNYDAEKLNCQNFLLNVLSANGIGDKSDQDFIFQDATQIFKELPEFSKVLGRVSVKLGAIFNRLLYGEGYGRQQDGGASRVLPKYPVRTLGL